MHGMISTKCRIVFTTSGKRGGCDHQENRAKEVTLEDLSQTIEILNIYANIYIYMHVSARRETAFFSNTHKTFTKTEHVFQVVYHG